MNSGITGFIKDETDSDSFDGIGEFMEKAQERESKKKESNANLRKQLREIRLEENHWEEILFSYWNIKFNLQKRTLEIWNKRWKHKITNIDKFRPTQSNLWNKTPTAIMLLYCIIMSATNNDFVIKDKFSDYRRYIDKYRLLLWINKNRELPANFDDYVSTINTLLELSQSGYEITHKKWSTPRMFRKAITNKSS